MREEVSISFSMVIQKKHYARINVDNGGGRNAAGAFKGSTRKLT